MTGRALIIFFVQCSHGAVSVEYETGRALIIFYVQCSHGAVSGEYETGRALIIFYVQCSHGAVSGEYETGRALMNAGVIPSSDITPEAALTKLSYVLAKVKCSY